MVKEISLNHGQVALVDDEDYEWLTQWKWFAYWVDKTNGYYARRTANKNDNMQTKTRKTIHMHRLIVNPPKDKFVDHINHDTLDNRKENLRVVSNRQNSQNQKRRYTSRYPGVSWHNRHQRWRAVIGINGKQKHLGYFSEEREAARAYERACRELCGEELVCKIRRMEMI